MRSPFIPLQTYLFNNKIEGTLTAVPMVSVSILPNCPCFYREFL